MSSTGAEDDYSSNIDDQLLRAVKQDGDKLEEQKSQQINSKVEDKPSIQQHGSPQHQLANAKYHQQQEHQLQHHLQHSQLGGQGQLGEGHHSEGHLHYNQQDVDESEYNIQIPDPIVDSKLKIYPVNENTITAEGNLITRPYPEQLFRSRDELNDFISEFARDNGFGVVIAHSNKKAIYYTCELGGRYRHKKSKKEVDESKHIDIGNGYFLDPNTKTKKLKCPFSMTASHKKSTGVWTLKTTCNEHNHPQLDPLSNHPMLRKRSDELNLLILDLYKVGTKPSHIESKIKEQYPDVLIKREDIYNEIRGYKRKLKKQLSRFGGLSHNQNRINQYKKRTQNVPIANVAGSKRNVDAARVAAAAAAAAEAAQAATNVFLNGGNDDDGTPDAQVLQYEIQQQQQQQHQQQQEEFQRQFNVAAAEAAAHHHQLDDQHYQQYGQDLQDHGLQDNDSTAAAAIAAVANAARHHHHHHNDASELSIDNIDSRLVGE
jgi:hypothetical protein